MKLQIREDLPHRLLIVRELLDDFLGQHLGLCRRAVDLRADKTHRKRGAGHRIRPIAQIKSRVLASVDDIVVEYLVEVSGKFLVELLPGDFDGLLSLRNRDLFLVDGKNRKAFELALEDVPLSLAMKMSCTFFMSSTFLI